MVISNQLIYFFLCIFAFIFIVLCSITNFEKKQDKRAIDFEKVYLESEKVTWATPSQWVHYCIEIFVFGRFESIKNNPRGNFFFLVSIYRTSITLFAALALLKISILLLSINITSNQQIDIAKLRILFLAITTWLGGINATYFSIKNTYRLKWEYLGGLYNTLLASIPTSTEAQYALAVNTLAIDIVITGMWGHRSYSPIVLSEITKAYEYYNTIYAIESKRPQSESDSDKEIKRLRKLLSGESYFKAKNILGESEAIRVLEEYQVVLLIAAKTRFAK